ncbi:thioredoxin family protein [Helicobacter sp. 11S02629-2]|uniref:thioredoxin family protein n=1 Tax=Helicobacter sp. 11S02629-2 TaxID=1476195 RepID=UPI000BA69A1F|nr:thioredoxin family protein [Helicobacter sp. 11S02629-2]PAF44980.1 thiol reductase thioredoxin [Helicobacter sp. 11S02629-2]
MENLVQSTYNDAIKSGVVVVDVGANWCPDCRRIKPVVEAMSKEYAGKAKFYEVDFSEEEALKDSLGIKRIPTIIFYKDGVEVGTRLVEPASRTPIEDTLKSIL